MNIVQGFVTIPALTNNVPGQTSDFGEFTTTSETFTRDLRSYSNTTRHPHIEVHTLKVIDDKSNNIVLSQELQRQMLLVADWIYTQHTKSAIPNNSSKTTLQNAVQSEFSFTSNVKVGEIMPTSVPNKNFIDYIQFDISYGGQIYRFTLWYNESRFRTQYKYYEIVIIPPIDDINRFIGSLADVALAVNGTKLQSVTRRINEQNRKAKITEIQTMSLDWHDPNASQSNSSVFRTEWTLLIYGNAGTDNAAMKSAIRDYLYANSDYSEWPSVFPELFSSNEFIIIPIWDKLATSKSTYDDGLYSTWTNNKKLEAVKAKYIPQSYKIGDKPNEFIKANITVGSVFYRTMLILGLGNPANKDNKYSLDTQFPDYMAVSTSSPDFGRMSLKTQEFVLKLNDAMNKARLFAPYEKLPEGYEVSVKAGREYLGFDYDGYTYYVLTRSGYLRSL